MLISTEVEIRADWASVKRYEELGYGKMRQGDVFLIKVEHLKLNSTVIVDVECDYCSSLFKRKYSEYIRNTKIQGKFSCLKCTNNKYRATCLNKYGVDNISKLKETHDKIKETSMERYGVSSYVKLDFFKEDHKSKMLNKYGVTSFSKTDEFLIKQKNTCLERFGVENASQNSVVFSKQQKKRFEIKSFRETDLYYQGSYEKDFLEKFYDLTDIVKMNSIDYEFNGNRVYFPDFFLPKYNLIVEIKSNYTYEKYLEQNIAKQNRCLAIGYNFIFIVDKNYDYFKSIVGL